jgi:hypothetical protein
MEFPGTDWHGRDMPVFVLAHCFTELFTRIAAGIDAIAGLETDMILLSHARLPLFFRTSSA